MSETKGRSPLGASGLTGDVGPRCASTPVLRRCPPVVLTDERGDILRKQAGCPPVAVVAPLAWTWSAERYVEVRGSLLQSASSPARGCAQGDLSVNGAIAPGSAAIVGFHFFPPFPLSPAYGRLGLGRCRRNPGKIRGFRAEECPWSTREHRDLVTRPAREQPVPIRSDALEPSEDSAVRALALARCVRRDLASCL